MAILVCEVFDLNTWVFASGPSNSVHGVPGQQQSPLPSMHMSQHTHNTSFPHSMHTNAFNQIKPSAVYTGVLPITYGYDDDNGPAKWKERYLEAKGNKQSPINICSKNAIVMPHSPLMWSPEYSAMPMQVVLWNDGHTVIIQPQWQGARPSITGGPLAASYELVAIRFRWGACDDEGSEHTVDYVRYAMELQAIHVKSSGSCCNQENQNSSNPEGSNMVIISYLFQITDIENPYLDVIVDGLKMIRQANTKVFLPPFPVSWLLPAFVSDYYMYTGSMTNPPCTEGIRWIIQPEPLAISSRQVRKFRKLLSESGHPLVSNCRPLQKLNKRDVLYYSNLEE